MVGPGAVGVAVGKVVAVGWGFGLLTIDICRVPQEIIKKAVIKIKIGLIHFIDKEKPL